MAIGHWVEEHPLYVAGGVFVIGLIIVYWLFSGPSAAPASSGAAAPAPASNGALQAAQIAAQAQTAIAVGAQGVDLSKAQLAAHTQELGFQYQLQALTAQAASSLAIGHEQYASATAVGEANATAAEVAARQARFGIEAQATSATNIASYRYASDTAIGLANAAAAEVASRQARISAVDVAHETALGVSNAAYYGSLADIAASTSATDIAASRYAAEAVGYRQARISSVAASQSLADVAASRATADIAASQSSTAVAQAQYSSASAVAASQSRSDIAASQSATDIAHSADLTTRLGTITDLWTTSRNQIDTTLLAAQQQSGGAWTPALSAAYDAFLTSWHTGLPAGYQ